MRKTSLIFLISVLLACSSDQEADRTISFIGDSIIANWDVEIYFPNRITENQGLDGIGISQLSTTKAYNKIAVIMIGTNDLTTAFDNQQLSTYCEQYEKTITGIGAICTILISVLPTADKGKNEVIKKFNTEMKSRMEKYTQVRYVNCYEDFTRDEVLKEELSHDGVHLNDYGYIILSDRVKETL